MAIDTFKKYDLQPGVIPHAPSKVRVIFRLIFYS